MPGENSGKSILIVLFLVFQILPYTINYFPLPWKDHVMDLLQTVQPGNGYRITQDILYWGIISSHYEVSERELEKTGLCTGGSHLIMAAIRLVSHHAHRGIRKTRYRHIMRTTRWPDFSGEVQLFLFFKNHVSRDSSGHEKQEEVDLPVSGSCTFGVSLIHALIRDILHRAGVDSMVIGNYMQLRFRWSDHNAFLY